MLYACLLMRSLALDVFARALQPAQAGRPFIVASGGHHPRVVAANAAAGDAGIRRDQLVSAALALAPDVALRDRDLSAEQAALEDVATEALAFTPNVSIALPDAIIAEVQRSARLFGGLPRLLERMQDNVAARGFEARLALAPTPTAAVLLARADCATPVFDVTDLTAALMPLPLALMDLDAETLATLKAAGITTFGAAYALPRAGLARRFGRTLVDTLDRALGRAADPRLPYAPPPRFERTLPLPAPVDDVEALGFGVQRLVHQLAGWLLARGLGVVRLSLVLHHERHVRARGTPPTRATFALGAPARAPAHLVSVLRERLAKIALPAPVEAIVLTSDETAALAGHNLGLLPEDEAGTVVVPLVDRLRARLGDDAVVTLQAQAEHRPEYAMRETACATSPARTGAPSIVNTRRARATDDPARQARRTSRHARSNDISARQAAPTVAPRPAWLLEEAQPLGATLEAKPWILRDGPERIESGWWDGRDFRRDYFVAETPRREIVWIYRDHRYGTDDGEWFLHGYFA